MKLFRSKPIVGWIKILFLLCLPHSLLAAGFADDNALGYTTPNSQTPPHFGIEIEVMGDMGYDAAECFKNIYIRKYLKIPYPSIESRLWFKNASEATSKAVAWSALSLEDKGWSSTCDASVSVEHHDSRTVLEEIISPILSYNDKLQVKAILQLLQHAGGQAVPGSGIHIHVAADHLNIDALLHLMSFVYRYEQHIYDTFHTTHQRYHGARRLRKDFIEELIKTKPNNAVDLSLLFAGKHGIHGMGCDLSPYHRLGTVEFRYFNSSLDWDTVSTYIDTAYAIMKYAATQGPFTQKDWQILTDEKPTRFSDFLDEINQLDDNFLIFELLDLYRKDPLKLESSFQSSDYFCKTAEGVCDEPVLYPWPWES